MLRAMYQLALDYLYTNHRLDGEPEDPDEWYRHVRTKDPIRLLQYLIESPRTSMASNYYVLSADPYDPNVAVLEQREFDPDRDAARIPFVQSTGSQSAAIGPVIKRSFASGKGAGPSSKILQTTLDAFEDISRSGKPWSSYFGEALDIMSRSTLVFQGRESVGAATIMQAVQVIDEKRTAYLTVLDDQGRLPGERPEYIEYLQEILGEEKYSTLRTPPVRSGIDALTGAQTTVYANSLSGAGVNINNVDRLGAFSGLDSGNAWKKFALSADSADLLYVFGFHLRDEFVGRVAGEKALILPEVMPDFRSRLMFMAKFRRLIEKTRESDSVEVLERRLATMVEGAESLAGISIVWASFGQKMSEIRGMVLDVLPSRLSDLSHMVTSQRSVSSPVFPRYPLEQFDYDLALNGYARLLTRPGGRASRGLNESSRLFAVKRTVAAALYHKRKVDERLFWHEVMETARQYLIDMLRTNNSYGLTQEGRKKDGTIYPTLAGWIKHLAGYLDFFRKAGVLSRMDTEPYVPDSDLLKPFFADSADTSGLDTDEKRYVFLVGALFGKLMSVQAARGVNVTANALSWLKRLNLTPEEIPGLYVKIVDRLYAYLGKRGISLSKEMAQVNREIARLGIKIGTPHALSTVETNYYLLLGQALSSILMPSKSKDETGEGGDGSEQLFEQTT